MSRRRGFLDLPSQLRQRIYRYAEITGKVIDLNWQYDEITLVDSDGEITEVDTTGCRHENNSAIVSREDYFTLERHWEYDEEQRGSIRISDSCCDNEGCFAWDSGFALLLASKTIFLEIWEMVYRENRYLLDRSAPGGFQRFMNLGWHSIRVLTHLTIRLDGEPPETMDLTLHWTRTQDLLPLKPNSRYGKQAYKQWADLVARLCECPIAPGRLNLFLVASVAGVNEAELVLRPLESLPSLKRCGIWLNEKPIPELKALIRETVERLIMPKDGEEKEEEVEKVEYFRYLDLPQEIRLRILSFSDICATPSLEWKPVVSELGPVRVPDCDCYDDLGELDKGLHYENCEQTFKMIPRKQTNGLEEEYNRIEHCCSCPSRWPYCSVDCMVRCDPYMCIFECSNHASHTAPRHRGWKHYCHPLFLVSRQVRHDAIPVFFQGRRFVITPIDVVPLRHLKNHAEKFHAWYTNPLPRMELSLFLSNTPKEAMRHIRYIEWLVAAPRNYKEQPRSAYFDYLNTIEVMVRAMTLSRMTLVINMRAARVHDLGYEGYDNRFIWPGREKSDGKFYSSILAPLGFLGENGLKDCWVYLRKISNAKYDCYSRDEDEKKWEKKIMGNASYDAFSRGKPWQERVERTMGTPQHDLGNYASYREHYPNSYY